MTDDDPRERGPQDSSGSSFRFDDTPLGSAEYLGVWPTPEQAARLTAMPAVWASALTPDDERRLASEHAWWTRGEDGSLHSLELEDVSDPEVLAALNAHEPTAAAPSLTYWSTQKIDDMRRALAAAAHARGQQRRQRRDGEDS